MGVPIILALGGVAVVLMLVWAPLSERLALTEKKGNCAALQAQLSVLRSQGGSVDEQLKLETQLRQCQADLSAAGVDVDTSATSLAAIRDIRKQMRQEYLHLKSTDYADILKRGSTYGTILRLGEDLTNRYRALMAGMLDDAPALTALWKEIKVDVSDAVARRNCYLSGSSGCGRYFGSTENDPESKAAGETERIIDPLTGVKNTINARLGAMGETPRERNRAARAEALERLEEAVAEARS